MAEVEGDPGDGDEVRLLAHDGSFVGRGLYNAGSQIRVRLYAWGRDAPLDGDFFRGRLDEALAVRDRLGLLDGPSRLVFSEGDGLSGLVVDRYGDHLAVQLTSLALAARRDLLLDHLEARLSPRSVVLRTEKGIREEEGLEVSDGVLRGDAPDGPVTVEVDGLVFDVDLRTGQKTGFFLDQRENRAAVAPLARGRDVADVCCYTGGFALPMARAGAASVVGVDVSEPSLELAARNAEANGLADRVRFVRADAFRWLEGEAEADRRYGMVVLDPPRFARSSRGVPQALRGYARLNRLAVRCLEPGGVLVTCSCTGRVSADDFLGAVAEAERSTGRRIRVLARRGQAADHPVSPTCPETAYLKCLVCAVE